MIIQAVLNWFSGVLAGLAGFLPPLPAGLSSDVASVPGLIQDVVNSVAMLGPVIPFDQIGSCIAIFSATFAVAMGAYIILKVLSLSLGGGGAL